MRPRSVHSALISFRALFCFRCAPAYLCIYAGGVTLPTEPPVFPYGVRAFTNETHILLLMKNAKCEAPERQGIDVTRISLPVFVLAR